MKKCSYEPDAKAVVLCHYGEMEFFSGSYLQIDFHKRIKILDETALESGNIFIPYYSKDGTESISQFEGQIFSTSEKGVFEKIKVDKSAIIKEEIDENWSALKISFPQVKKGAVLEYKYTLKSKQLITLEAREFQEEYPVLHSEFTVNIARDYQYRILYNGFRLIEKYGGEPTRRWILANLPSLKKEPFMANKERYAEKITLQLEAYRDLGHYKAVLKNWDFLADEFLEERYFRQIYTRSKIVEDVIEENSLKKDNYCPYNTFNRVKSFVANAVRWNGEHRTFPTRTIPDLMKENKGNSAEVNLLMTSILKELGFDAYPFLVPTRDYGKTNKNYPFIAQFNNMICAVKMDEEWVFIDATTPNHPAGILPEKDLNEFGFLIDKKQFGWLPVKTSEKIKAVTVINIDPQNQIATVQYRAEEHAAIQLRSALFGEESLEVKAARYLMIKDEFQDEIQNFKITGLDTISQPIDISFDIRLDGTLNMDSNAPIYINPHLLSLQKDNPFKSDFRYYPVEYPIAIDKKQIVTIKIPEGYTVEFKPESIALGIPGNSIRLIYQAVTAGNQVMVTAMFSAKDKDIWPENYLHLKEMYSQLTGISDNMIVLKKL